MYQNYKKHWKLQINFRFWKLEICLRIQINYYIVFLTPQKNPVISVQSSRRMSGSLGSLTDLCIHQFIPFQFALSTSHFPLFRFPLRTIAFLIFSTNLYAYAHDKMNAPTDRFQQNGSPFPVLLFHIVYIHRGADSVPQADVWAMVVSIVLWS